MKNIKHMRTRIAQKRLECLRVEGRSLLAVMATNLFQVVAERVVKRVRICLGAEHE